MKVSVHYYFRLFVGVDKKNKKNTEYYHQSLHHPSFDHEGRLGTYFTHNATEMLAVLSNILRR